jgi:hypothetical protein
VAQESWPAPDHNARAVTDLEYERLSAHFSDNGIYGTPADAAVASAGVGLNVAIRANVYGSVRGHGWTSGADGDTLPIDPNSSGQTRIDRVVLRLTRSDWTVRAVVKKGTPGAGVPSLAQSTGDTGTYEIPLAEARLLSGATSVTVTRKELYVGTRIRPCTSSTRNPVPVVSEINYEADTKRAMLWTGTSWEAIFEDSGVVDINNPNSAWSIETDSVLEKRNGSVHLRLGSFKRTAGSLASSAESRLPAVIPSGYRHPTRDQYALAYCTGVEVARIIVYSAASPQAGQVVLANHPTIATGEFVLPASGLSWVV